MPLHMLKQLMDDLQGNINGLMMDFLFITITIILLRVKIIYK